MNYYDDFYSTPKQGNMSMGGSPQLQYMPMPSNMYPQMNPMDQNPLPSLPTGVPAGGIVGPIPMLSADVSTMDLGTPQAPTDSIQFVAGFLKTQIGRNMRVEFLIGTGGPLVDRLGTLVAVGTSYILIRPYGSKEIIMCDLYSIKFVTVFPQNGNTSY